MTSVTKDGNNLNVHIAMTEAFVSATYLYTTLVRMKLSLNSMHYHRRCGKLKASLS